MAHLTYHPSSREWRRELREAANEPLVVTDWAGYETIHSHFPARQPQYPWLGHDHESTSYYHRDGFVAIDKLTAFRLYGPAWRLDKMIENGDVRAGHPALEQLDATEAAYQVAAFIQAWLYFGLLEAVIAKPISSTYMTRSDNVGVKYLYSRMLPVLLEDWMKRLSFMAEDYTQESLETAMQCSFEASSTLAGIIKDLSSCGINSQAFLKLNSLLLSVEPAMSALHEAVATFARGNLPPGTRSFNLSESSLPKTYSENLIRKGWCRFVVSNAEKALTAAFMRFLDTAGFVGTTSGHEHCVAHACYRNNVDTSSYAPQHWLKGCQCEFMKPDLAAILNILDKGQIPVVRLSDHSLTLAVAALDPDDKKADYVAFSHVWADGLGSTTEVGFPTCQVQRLHKLAKKRTGDGSFWIDAICVPKQQPQRTKSIKLMIQTYENATGVILLDQGLRSLSTSNSDLEIGWSLFASSWFGRLWTYQEGFLARWVDMDVSDGMIDLYALVQRLYHRCYPRPAGNPFPSIFSFELLAMLQKVVPLDNQYRWRPPSRRLVDLFNALTRRQTSRPTDQFLVIGLLLGLDIDRSSALEGEERWKDLYLQIGKIPWTVTFDQRPKMALSPFTWAPSTWISTGGDQWLHYNDEEANITDNGLTATLRVLVLQERAGTKFSRVVLRTREPHFYELSWGEKKTGATPKLSEFDVLIARYAMGENPEDVLYDTRSVLQEAGLGLKGEILGDGTVSLSHDFTLGYEIREIVDMRELEQDTSPQIEASWMQLKCCFK